MNEKKRIQVVPGTPEHVSKFATGMQAMVDHCPTTRGMEFDPVFAFRTDMRPEEKRRHKLIADIALTHMLEEEEREP